MDLLVLPTHREGFPVAPLEAAAMELPVVATTATGCADAVVPGVTGQLVPPGDVGALACAIRAYVEDAARRQREGAAGRARVLREFRPERSWQALDEEYARLARNRGLVPPESVALDDPLGVAKC
jgi:glycosyltransferase involved in cell wall biosynthesis